MASRASPSAQRYQLEFLARRMLPGWVIGGLWSPPPVAGAAGTPPSPPSGPRARPPLSQELVSTPPPPKAASDPRKFPGPVLGTHKCPPPRPPDALASRPQDSQVPALPRTLGCAPYPAPPLLKLRGGAQSGPRRGPAAAAAQCDVSQAGPAPPPAAAATGAAGASRRVRQGCQASLNTPGGRYLVGGHRPEALEDGQDVLLAGVPHGHQRNEAQLAPPTGKGRAGAVAASGR